MAGTLTIEDAAVVSRRWWSPSIAGWLAAVCAVLVAISAVVPLSGFWVGDCGSRYLQMVNIADRHHFLGFSIDYPLRELDPGFELRPFERQHTFVHGGRLYTQYPPAFVFAAGVLYRIVGASATRAAPLAGAFMLLLGALHLGRACGLRWPKTAASVVLLGTPLLPYAFTFWDVLPAIAAGTWAAVFLLRAAETGGSRRAAAAGLCAFIGFLLREEYLLWGICLMACVFWHGKHGRRTAAVFAACFLLPVALTVLANLSAIGHPLFMMTWSSRDDPSLRWTPGSRLQVLYNVLAMTSYDPNLDMLLFAATCVVLLVGSRSPFLRILACVGGIVCALAARWQNWDFNNPPLLSWMRNSVLTASPLFFVGLAPVSRSSRAASCPCRYLLHVSLLFILLFLLACPKISSFGLQWGPRLLLPVYPLLVIRAFAVAEDLFLDRARLSGRVAMAGFCVLALIGFADSGVYLQRLRAKVSSGGQMLEFLEGTGSIPIVTNLESAGMDFAPLFYKRAMINSRGGSRLVRALEVARELGRGKAVYLARGDLSPEVTAVCSATELPLAQAAPVYQRQMHARAYLLDWARH